MAMMRTRLVSARFQCVPAGGVLTDDKQGIPLPLASATRALNGLRDLSVALGDVLRHILRILVDLFHLGFLLMHEFRDFLVQTAQLNHILFDLADGGGTLQSGLSGIVGLSGTAAGDLFEYRLALPPKFQHPR